ncbi:hypothetical protein BU26DRAFT_240902 [Trematosphaeria pertusa]|uniref:Uncharacterized protein n=1 Tax=Trematosphaeria pertusa TaxID=390896 RepID=A0A6A6IMJ7_9PLEO|nr:uncharacterized protein BU26DRAFT_240902 [Trematosphaeria pertusa]KAF2251646.1 hypothetical protein BU26DRAFT_240902 [Trematosphaeria pertusa]
MHPDTKNHALATLPRIQSQTSYKTKDSSQKRPRPDNHPYSPLPLDSTRIRIPLLIFRTITALIVANLNLLKQLLFIHERRLIPILFFILLNRRIQRLLLGPAPPWPSMLTHKKPLVPETRRSPPRRLPTFPFSLAATSPISPISRPMEEPRRLRTSPASLPAPGTPRALRRSTRRPFQPSSSRSRRRLFSFSSRSSRSARLAASWLVESEDWSSSIVLRSLEILSRALLRSSTAAAFCLSRRSIWFWRSLTVRSTLRMLRDSERRVVSEVSSAFSS